MSIHGIALYHGRVIIQTLGGIGTGKILPEEQAEIPKREREREREREKGREREKEKRKKKREMLDYDLLL